MNVRLIPLCSIGTFLAASLVTGGCGEVLLLQTLDQPFCSEEERLQVGSEPDRFAVYFVVDASGSMGPFLETVSDELYAFTENLPLKKRSGETIPVEYFVVGFVNDVRWFPSARSLRNPREIQAALAQGIDACEQNLNLNRPTTNAEPEENLLDALALVIDSESSADVKLVVIATDSGFAQAPSELSGDNHVRSTYEEILTRLSEQAFRVHVFARPHSDGLTRRFAGMPALSSLPGSSIHDLTALTGANQKIRTQLSNIAHTVNCY